MGIKSQYTEKEKAMADALFDAPPKSSAKVPSFTASEKAKADALFDAPSPSATSKPRPSAREVQTARDLIAMDTARPSAKEVATARRLVDMDLQPQGGTGYVTPRVPSTGQGNRMGPGTPAPKTKGVKAGNVRTYSAPPIQNRPTGAPTQKSGAEIDPSAIPLTSREMRNEVNQWTEDIAKGIRPAIPRTGLMGLLFPDFTANAAASIPTLPLNLMAEAQTVTDPRESLETRGRAGINIALQVLPIEAFAGTVLKGAAKKALGAAWERAGAAAARGELTPFAKVMGELKARGVDVRDSITPKTPPRIVDLINREYGGPKPTMKALDRGMPDTVVPNASNPFEDLVPKKTTEGPKVVMAKGVPEGLVTKPKPEPKPVVPREEPVIAKILEAQNPPKPKLEGEIPKLPVRKENINAKPQQFSEEVHGAVPEQPFKGQEAVSPQVSGEGIRAAQTQGVTGARQAKEEVGPPPVVNPEVVAPVSPRKGAEGERYAASNAAENDLRKRFGMEEVKPTPKGLQGEPLEYDRGTHYARLKKAYEDVQSGKKAPTFTEADNEATRKLFADQDAELRSLADKEIKAIEEGRDASPYRLRRESLLDEINTATQANKYVGTSQSAALRTRNVAVYDDYSPAGEYRVRTIEKGKKLTPEEQKAALESGQQVERLQKRVDELERQVQEKQAQQALDSIKQETPRATRKVDPEALKARRAAAVERIKAKWSASTAPGKIMSDPTGLASTAQYAKALGEIAPDVIEIAKTYVMEGAAALDDVVKGVRSHLPFLNDGDVEKILAGEYEKTPRPRQAGLLDDLKRQAKESEPVKAILDEREAAKVKAAAEKKAEADATREQLAEYRQKDRAKAAEERKAIEDAKKEADAKVKAARNDYRKWWSEQEKKRSQTERIQEGIDRRKFREAEEAKQKELQEKITEARKEQRKAESQAKADYQKWWRESIPGQRERMFESTERYKKQVATGEFKTRKKDPLARELDDAQIKLNAAKLEADEVRENLRREAQKASMSKKDRVMSAIGEIWALPRTLVASTDFSAPFNQGAFFTITHPFTSAKAASQMFRATLNEGALRNVNAAIRANPLFESARGSGLKLAMTPMERGEELFVSKLLGHSGEVDLPVKVGGEKVRVGLNPVAASERAYTAYLNKVRMDMFTNIVKSMESPWMGRFGQPKKLNLDELKQISEYVNTATGVGTGKIAGSLKNLNQSAGSAFFAPGYMASRWKLAFGAPGFNAAIRGNPKLAAYILKDYLKFAGAVAGTVYAAKQAGLDVETDIHSSNFGKIKKGNVTFDPWGGIMTPIRVLAQGTQGSINSKTGKQMKPNVATTGGYYGSARLSPQFSLAKNLIEGEAFGKKYDLKSEEGLKNVAMNMLPISVQQQFESGEIKGLTPEQVAVLRIASVFGANVNVKPEEGKGKGIR